MGIETGTMDVRVVGRGIRAIDVVGDVTPATEPVLMDAWGRVDPDATAVLLDFSGLEYMNSGGIGLLVTLLVRAQRDRVPLHACGLSDHYRQILALTRLDEAIVVHDDESTAVAAIEGSGS